MASDFLKREIQSTFVPDDTPPLPLNALANTPICYGRHVYMLRPKRLYVSVVRSRPNNHLSRPFRPSSSIGFALTSRCSKDNLFFSFFSFLLLTNPCIFAAETKKDMDFYNRYRPSDEHRREELIRKIEAAVNSLTLEELETLHYDMLTKNYGMNEIGEL